MEDDYFAIVEVEAGLERLGGEAATLEVEPCIIAPLLTFHFSTFHFSDACRAVVSASNDVVEATRASWSTAKVEVAGSTSGNVLNGCASSHFHKLIVVENVIL